MEGFEQQIIKYIVDSDFTIKYLKSSKYKIGRNLYNYSFIVSYRDKKIKTFEFTGTYKKPDNQFIVDCIKQEAIKGEKIQATNVNLRSFIMLKQSYFFISDVIDKLEIEANVEKLFNNLKKRK